jgi:uncharacterized membrane protein
MILTAAILLLTLLGFLISFHFTLISLGKVSLAQSIVPSFCRADTGTCTAIVGTREARIFGPSNALMGIWYYGFVFLAAATGWLGHKSVGSFLLLLSWVSLAVSLYLAYVLMYRLRVTCTLCFISHGVNLLLSLCLFLEVWGSLR